MGISLQQLELRKPAPTDGASVFRLINRCPPLDSNSMYCNLLQCTHFAGTSVAASHADASDKELVGFISGYLIPERNDTLFIWQVAVDGSVRGLGLAGKMLQHILHRSQCDHVRYLETTITETNGASWALFESLSKKLHTEIERTTMFDRDTHLAGQHATEYLARLGPF